MEAGNPPLEFRPNVRDGAVGPRTRLGAPSPPGNGREPRPRIRCRSLRCRRPSCSGRLGPNRKPGREVARVVVSAVARGVAGTAPVGGAPEGVPGHPARPSARGRTARRFRSRRRRFAWSIPRKFHNRGRCAPCWFGIEGPRAFISSRPRLPGSNGPTSGRRSGLVLRPEVRQSPLRQVVTVTRSRATEGHLGQAQPGQQLAQRGRRTGIPPGSIPRSRVTTASPHWDPGALSIR